MWVKIDKEIYMEKVNGLKPLSSVTDIDGTLTVIASGRPYIDTIWGRGDDEQLKCVMTKKDRHQLIWDTEYFENQ